MKKGFYLSGLLFLCFLLNGFRVQASVGSTGDGIPTITAPLANITTCPSLLVYFSAHATDSSIATDSVHYAWQVSADSGATWTNISNGGAYFRANTDSLQITADTSLGGNMYRFIATNDSGSVTSNAAFLTVIPLPFVSPVSGPDTLCAGSSIVLTDLGSGGLWSSANSRASVNIAGVVTGLIAGLDTITYKVTNICGSPSASRNIFIKVSNNPGVITNASAICVGSTVALADTATGGVWSSSNPSSATVDASGVVNGFAEGIDTIKYTITNADGCVTVASAVVRVDTTVVALPVTGPATTCIGATINLMNTNVNGTWTWTVSNGNATINSAGMVTGVSNGTDTFTYSFSNACNAVPSSAMVYVDTVLNHGAISGLSSVCAGSWISLSETTPGGVWISSNTGTAIVDASGDVTGESAGSVIISYYLTNGCGASIATYSVNVISSAAPITGLDSVGIGNMITLADATTGGTWSSTNTGIATVNSTGVVTGIGTGLGTILYTVTNFCGTSSSMFTVTVGPLPSAGTITGPDSVCIGSNVTLADAAAPGGAWSASNGNATVNASGVVSGLTYGKDTIYYAVTTGFGTTKISKVMKISRPPVDSLVYPATTALGETIDISGYPVGGVWTTTNNIVAEIVSGHFLAILQGGADTVIYTATNACGSTSDSFVIHPPVLNLAVGGVNTANASLNIYPNPSHGEFILNLESDKTEQAVVTITNVVGERVKEVVTTTNVKFDINLDQPAGIYFLSAKTADGTYSAKINIVK